MEDLALPVPCSCPPRLVSRSSTYLIAAMVLLAYVTTAPRLAAETFDLFDFTPPVGTRQSGTEYLGFVDSTPTTFAVYALYKNVAGSGDPARDFQDEWASIAAQGRTLTSRPSPRTTDAGAGWKRTLGSANAFGDQQGAYTVLMAVYTGYGRKVSVMVLYNSTTLQAKVERFLAGIRLTPPASASMPPSAAPQAPAQSPPPGAPQSTGRLATGFTAAIPPGFTQNGPWYVSSSVENRGGGREIVSALVRLPPSVKAQGRLEDALAALWPTLVPVELAERRGTMIFRRYVGDGLAAHFASGTGREAGRIADTMVTLYLVDCGTEWQPVVVAQTYDEPDTPPGFLFGVDQAGRLSFPDSAALAEPFLAALRCPQARGKPLATSAELAGDYAFGSAASQQWVNVYTGALSMTAVSYGGALNLKPDGTYEYRFTAASGVVGSMAVTSETARGRWSADGDLLTLIDSAGKRKQHRIAGVFAPPGGRKTAVLLDRLDVPVNPITVGNAGDYYTLR